MNRVAMCEEQSLGRAREGRRAWGTQQRGGRREGRGDFGTGRWLGRVGIRGQGQWDSVAAGRGRRGLGAGGPRVWNLGCEVGRAPRAGEAWTWSPDKGER